MAQPQCYRCNSVEQLAAVKLGDERYYFCNQHLPQKVDAKLDPAELAKFLRYSEHHFDDVCTPLGIPTSCFLG